MDLQMIKRHSCSLDQGDGILLVDIETETIPRTDGGGNPLYYCLAGHHIFSVDAHNNSIHHQSQQALHRQHSLKASQ